MTFPAYKQLWYIPPIRPRSGTDRGFSREDQERYIQEQQAAEQKKVELDTKKNTERLKNMKWTRDDLRKLVIEQEKILDDHFGDPQTFRDDMTLINNLLNKEKWEIQLEGTEKEKITSDGADYLYGLLLEAHTIRKGFYIEISSNNQPIIHDNQKPERTAKVKAFQAELNNLEFGVDRKNILRKYDNTSRIAVYLAALAYNNQEEKNLLKYREKIEKEIQTDPTKPLTVDEIKNSNLKPGQKSFLLAWRERKNDATLIEIQENQQKFVERAREDLRGKSREQHLAELKQRPVGKSIELFWAGILGAGLLVIGLKQLFWEKSGPIGKFFGVIMALIGGAIALPMIDKWWQALEGPEMLNSFTADRPVDVQRGNDNPFHEAAEWSDGLLERLQWGISWLQWRISGPQEWTELVMRPELEPATKTYPVGAMLYLMYEWSPTEQAQYANFKPDTAQTKEIEKTLGKLNTPSDKTAFRKLLEVSWNRHMEINPGLQSNLPEARKLTLPSVIASLDTADSWLNYVPDWLWGNTKKVEALKIMAPKAKEWGEFKLSEIQGYFLKNPVAPNATIEEILQDFRDKNKSWPDPKTILIPYFTSFDFTNPEMTLRDYLKNIW